MISFKASVIGSAYIQKLTPDKNFTDYQSRFVELNTDSNEDYEAIRTIARSWKQGSSFVVDMFDSFATDRFLHNETYKRYFALIKTHKPQLGVCAETILGVAAIKNEKDGTCTISQLQVDPDHEHGSSLRRYKGIGKQLLSSILDLIPNKEFTLYASSKSAKIFYEKLNFIQKPNSIFMHLKR